VLRELALGAADLFPARHFVADLSCRQ
jgi:hypothetical protein